MKLWNRWVGSMMAGTFILSLSFTMAYAQSNDSTGSGVNTSGRPGYFFSDTAFVPEKNQIMGSGSIIFSSPGSVLSIPVGAAYGLGHDIQIHADTSFYTENGASGLGDLTFGGKYSFKTKVERLLVAVGLDFSVGPLTNSSYSSFNFDPYGIVTYTFDDDLQLNGQLGIMILGGYSVDNPLYGYYPDQPKTISVGGSSYVQFNAGASYPLGNKLTGIAELDVNGLGSGSTPLVVGIRTGHDIQLQAFGGLDLATDTGVIIGGSVGLVSE